MTRENISLGYYEARLLYNLLYGMDYEKAMQTISKKKKAELGNKLCDCYTKQEGEEVSNGKLKKNVNECGMCRE